MLAYTKPFERVNNYSVTCDLNETKLITVERLLDRKVLMNLSSLILINVVKASLLSRAFHLSS